MEATAVEASGLSLVSETSRLGESLHQAGAGEGPAAFPSIPENMQQLHVFMVAFRTADEFGEIDSDGLAS